MLIYLHIEEDNNNNSTLLLNEFAAISTRTDTSNKGSELDFLGKDNNLIRRYKFSCFDTAKKIKTTIFKKLNLELSPCYDNNFFPPIIEISINIKNLKD